MTVKSMNMHETNSYDLNYMLIGAGTRSFITVYYHVWAFLLPFFIACVLYAFYSLAAAFFSSQHSMASVSGFEKLKVKNKQTKYDFE